MSKLEFLFIILIKLVLPSIAIKQLIINQTDRKKLEDCTILNHPNISESPPIVKLVEANFHTQDTLPNPICKGSLLYTLPITFQSLKFTCDASYPTIWRFETPPHDCPLLKDFTITKRRIIKSYWNNSTYTFSSNLTLNFKDPYLVPTIFCTRSKVVGSNLTSTIKSVNLNDTFRIGVQITREYKGIPPFDDKRAGKNKNCSVSLQLHTDTQTFKCSNNSRPQIIHCNNPDECNSIFVLDDYGNESVCNTTFDQTNCTSNKCVQLLVSYTPAVIVCRDQANNSIARRYFIYPPKNVSERPIMRLGRNDEIEIASETISLEPNETKIYFGQTVTFKCIGAGAYYSYGFQWGLLTNYSNLTILDQNNSSESFNATIHSYQAQTSIKFDKELFSNSTQVTIVCLGPRWNKFGWINATYDVHVKEPEKPKIIRKEIHYVISEDSSEYYQYTFFCDASGNPVPEIFWAWNLKNLGSESSGEFYKIIHHSNDENGTTNSTLSGKMRRNDPINNIVTCTARSNYCNETASYEFRIASNVQTGWWKRTTVIVGCVSTILLVAVSIVAYLLTRRHYRRKLQLLSDEEIHEFENGNSNSDTHALILPYSMDNEIPQQEITILDTSVLGEGQFGMVYKGLYKSRTVAVKTTKKTAEVRHLKSLLAEIKILCYVGNHDNLVNMIGACTRNMRKREIYLLTEFCENGSLIRFLKQSRGMCLDLFNTNKAIKDDMKKLRLIDIKNDCINVLPCINTLHLVTWALDITCAMEYLASKKVVHGDLAARNVLLTEGLVAKVGDFGLSKQLIEDYGIYVQQLECPLPLKWLAIECLQDFEFSVSSDCWAFGVTLWELFSLGATPYPGIPQWNFQSYTLLKNGYRMAKPQFSNDSIYKVMGACWDASPKARPSFTELKTFFQQMVTSLKKMY